MKRRSILRIALLIVVGALGGILLWSAPSRGEALGDWASVEEATGGVRCGSTAGEGILG